MRRKYFVCNRSARGSGLAVVGLGLGLFVLCAWFGLSVLSAFYAKQSLQNEAERVSLKLSLILNREDRTGRMNSLAVDCSELVFDSRKAVRLVQQDRPGLDHLARRLENDAVTGLNLVRDDQEKLISSTLTELRDACQREQRELTAKGNCAYLLWQGLSPRLQTIQLGKIASMESNVPANQQNYDFFKHESQSGNLTSDLKLYRSHVSLSDVQLTLSPLPQMQERLMSQAGLHCNSRFDPVAFVVKNGKTSVCQTTFVPTAVSVQVMCNARDQAGSADRGMISATSVSCSNGGGLTPPLL